MIPASAKDLSYMCEQRDTFHGGACDRYTFLGRPKNKRVFFGGRPRQQKFN
jgi:hypothetical protein